jgi:hypothetical protein
MHQIRWASLCAFVLITASKICYGCVGVWSSDIPQVLQAGIVEQMHNCRCRSISHLCRYSVLSIIIIFGIAHCLEFLQTWFWKLYLILWQIERSRVSFSISHITESWSSSLDSKSSGQSIYSVNTEYYLQEIGIKLAIKIWNIPLENRIENLPEVHQTVTEITQRTWEDTVDN